MHPCVAGVLRGWAFSLHHMEPIPGQVYPCLFAGFEGTINGRWWRIPLANAGEPGSLPGLARSLEEEVATHSSIPCLRKSHGQGEPIRPQSMG